MTDDDLYKQTLDLYNDPAFAHQYANNIANRSGAWKFDAFLPYVIKGGKVLDVACAAGRDSAYLDNHGYQAVGIDLSNELISIAKQAYPNIEFVVGDFTKLAFRDDSFDGIWCRAALVHLPSSGMVLKSLKEFRRVLKQGGVTMVNTKARLHDQPETALKQDILSDHSRYFRYFKEDELLELCKQAGLTVIEHKSYNENDDPNIPNRRDENWLFVIAKK